MEKIVLLGAGGHAKSIIDSIESKGDYLIAGYTDLNNNYPYRDIRWLGTDEVLEELYKTGIRHAFVAIGYLGSGKLRDLLYAKLKSIGYTIPTIIDPSAIIGRDVTIDEGVYIGKRAVVNANSRIGKMSIINTGAIVEHDNSIGEYTHVSVGATLCGMVNIGHHCFVGANSTVIQEVHVSENSIIGAGSTVLNDVKANQKVYGVIRKSDI